MEAAMSPALWRADLHLSGDCHTYGRFPCFEQTAQMSQRTAAAAFDCDFWVFRLLIWHRAPVGRRDQVRLVSAELNPDVGTRTFVSLLRHSRITITRGTALCQYLSTQSCAPICGP